jgi:hypothetical protein
MQLDILYNEDLESYREMERIGSDPRYHPCYNG